MVGMCRLLLFFGASARGIDFPWAKGRISPPARHIPAYMFPFLYQNRAVLFFSCVEVEIISSSVFVENDRMFFQTNFFFFKKKKNGLASFS